MRLIKVLGVLFVLTGFGNSDMEYKYKCTDQMGIFMDFK